MITSKQIISLSEEWLLRSHGIDIYVNPTSSDYLEFSKKKIGELRFIADNRTKKIYVTDAARLVHAGIASSVSGLMGSFFNFNSFEQYPDWALAGVAMIHNGQGIMTGADSLNYLKRNSYYDTEALEHLMVLLLIDWSWCNKYIKVTDWLSKFKSTVKMS